MRDLLSRFYRLKLILTCLVLVIIGLSLISVSKQIDHWHIWPWITYIPLGEFGGILVGAGLLSLWIDYLFTNEKQASEDLRLQKILQDQAPAMRDAVLEAFAANHEDLARVATPDMLDQIIRNSLALRLHDDQFATEVYNDIRDQAVSAAERWHDATVSIDLSPLPMGRGTAERSTPIYDRRLFNVTVRWEYTVVPVHPERRFVSTSDRSEYNELAHERGDTSAWFIKPGSGIDASDRQSFDLLQFAVNGEQRPIRRTQRKNGQAFSASIGADLLKAGKPVTISYLYRTITAQAGHLLFFDIEQPTRDISVEFDYSGCELSSVSVLDLIASVRPTRTERSPAELPSSTIRVELDGWVFPRSGIAFVWTLDAEAPQPESIVPS